MRSEVAVHVLLALALAGCHHDPQPPPVLGETAWDRINLIAPASEPLLAVHVAQGDTVRTGQLVAELDPQRAQARLAQAQADVARAAAALQEALNGARPETLSAARAQLASLKASRVEALREQSRIEDLVARGLAAERERDRVIAAAQRASAAEAAGKAQLRELLKGTRAEQLAQAEATLAASQAASTLRERELDELALRAPRDGWVDALPFEAGDRPPLGASVASLLVGTAPHARVYVPASLRAQVAANSRFDLRVEGIETPLSGRLREIAAEPAFTPYYALSGDDASQLVYRAEILIDDPAAARLPAGLPVQATLRDER